MYVRVCADAALLSIGQSPSRPETDTDNSSINSFDTAGYSYPSKVSSMAAHDAH
jgi:hypothetical protein